MPSIAQSEMQTEPLNRTTTLPSRELFHIMVTIEQTPNPAVISFRLSEKILETSMNFESASDAERSPLAYKLFGFPWVTAVLLGPDFVSVTKQDWVEWNILADPLAELIQEHFKRGEGIIHESKPMNEARTEFCDDDTPLIREIKILLAREIRPQLALDGGDVAFAEFKQGVLTLHFKGACSGCPSSQATLKGGIEVRMKEKFPEIESVIAFS